MGWLYHAVPSRRLHDRDQEIDRIFTTADPAYCTYEVLQKSWRGNNCYVACRVTYHITSTTLVFGCVVLTKSYTEHGQRWWGYKVVEETSGPCPSHTQAPKSLIAKLTPTDSVNAQQWRAACLANAAAAAARPIPKHFRTREPIKFPSANFTAQEFKRAHIPRRRGLYYAQPHNTLVRLYARHLEGAIPL